MERTQEANRRARDASVLFVCLGNICRSPTAEAVFRERAARAGLAQRIVVDSAGTGDWHVGRPPDRRAIAHAAKRGYDLTPLRARQVAPGDFDRFRWILAMDEANLRDLQALRPRAHHGHLGLFLDFAPSLGVREVPDPYYGGLDGFERVLDLVEEASERLLEHVGRGLRTGDARAPS
ncbi:MAG: low molecular weight phosphotyrosine protein phosphatase [Burkholderiales bacterium]|nr:low molecular weight phosphotyrosine protein phosphatase [Burkholderiales bacterium]GIK88149.1 MAG: phosphotyrosine protein phosphatase [Betaproteobacteria bacterium]